MVNYVKLADTAKRLIKKNGRVVNFVRSNSNFTDPDKPWEGSNGLETLVPLAGVFVPPSSLRNFGLPALGEGHDFQNLILFSEQIIIVFPDGYDLTDFESVKDGNTTWGITAIQILKPADVTLLGYVGVRR